MQKCPKCGNWTLKFDPMRQTLACYKPGCDYEEPVKIDEYFAEHDMLPKLAKSLELNGHRKKMVIESQ